MNLLLDPTVMIDVIRFRNQRNEFLAELARSGHRLCTSTLNIAELYAGIRPGESDRVEALLSGLEYHELSASIARLAGQMRNAWAHRGRTLTLADTIVAATAIDRGCALLTDNRKDFPMPEVQLYPLP
jgi:predicted nucleic acid-binding protein